MTKLKKILVKLTPHFAKRIDATLITRSPVLWSSKLHYILIYSLTLFLCLGGIAVIYPVSIHTIFDPTWLLIIMGVLSLIALIIWFHYLSKFDMRKCYGRRTRLYDLKYTVICCIGIFSLFASWLGPSWILSQRTLDYVDGSEKDEQFETTILNRSDSYRYLSDGHPYLFNFRYLSSYQLSNSPYQKEKNIAAVYLNKLGQYSSLDSLKSRIQKKTTIKDKKTGKLFHEYLVGSWSKYTKNQKPYVKYLYQDDYLFSSHEYLSVLRLDRMLNDFMETNNLSLAREASAQSMTRDEQIEFFQATQNINSHNDILEFINDVPVVSVALIILFYFLILQSVVSLFGIKCLLKSVALIAVSLVLGYLMVVFSYFVTGNKFRMNNDGELVLLGVILFCCVFFTLYLNKIKKFTGKAFSFWLFVVNAFPPIIIIGAFSVLSLFNLQKYYGDVAETLLLFTVLPLVFVFLPWQRSVVYKLYSLPK